MINSFGRYITSPIELIYPNLCPACRKNFLENNKEQVCLDCKFELADYEIFERKDLKQKVKYLKDSQIEELRCLFDFKKDSPVRNIIHALKYRNKKELGNFVGNYLKPFLGNEFKEIDFVIPVPIHPFKRLQRGYNQVDGFAVEIANYLDVPFLNDGLIRQNYSKPQARKTLKQRLISNKSNTFVSNKKYNFKESHILLIDDVVTTGLTIRQCADEIFKIKGSKVTVLSMTLKI